MTKVCCQECGKDFEAKPSRIKKGAAKFCSMVCYNKNKIGEKNPRYNKITQICPECGKEFLAKPSQIQKGDGKFCSRDCFGKYRSKTNIGEKNPNWKGGDVIKTCGICGKKFKVKHTPARYGYGKYCSKECVRAAISRFHSGENSSRWKEKITRICSECGKKFEILLSQCGNGRGVYCSFECKTQAQKRTLLGEKNPHWLGGKSFEPYCPKFNLEFKERVRKWFDYICVECGTPQFSLDTKLHVHHVNFNKNTCCDDTIPLFVPLCTSCHTRSGSNRDYWNKHFTELINTFYGGKCYYSKEEFDEIQKCENVE